ncbi:hypothetical protein K7X08_030400 [Anisodus acutangulus]|uniref:Uncharacterized protein n=1 Tax=Anisodus acutangulus TaxID=402998 RepID=A0A9Q1LR82_9SOLA|nr:hypothetical protein K7X08_030400 [Anisodus acutangulus]
MVTSDGGSDRAQYLQDFLLIKNDDKFFSRLLSKENSNKGESSFRFYYYGGSSSSSSIPFHWESEPGTPKHKFTNSTLLNPPLTPPPSYNNQSINSHFKSLQKLHSKPKIYNSIFSKRITSSSSIASLSPSSSRSSSFSMSSMPLFAYSSNYTTNFQSKSQVAIANSPTSSRRCFDSRSGNKSKRFRVGYYSMQKVKKLLLSFIRIRS